MMGILSVYYIFLINDNFLYKHYRVDQSDVLIETILQQLNQKYKKYKKPRETWKKRQIPTTSLLKL